MARANNYNNSAKANAIAEFLQKYWMVVIAVIVLIPWIKKYYTMMFASIADQEREIALDNHFEENKNPGILKAKFDSATHALQQMNYPFVSGTPEKLQSVARELAEKLGTIYSDTGAWWCKLDPRGWFEDDTGTADLLILYGADMQALTMYYYEYTRKRNLLDDIIQLLNPAQKQRVVQQNPEVML